MHNDREVNHFRLDLIVHHPTCDSDSINLALGLTPGIKLMAGQTIGTKIKKSTFWVTKFWSGITGEEFSQALEDILAFFEAHREYILTFISDNGEITLQINQNITWDDGKLMELNLHPRFIQELGNYPIGLTIQEWSSEDKGPVATSSLSSDAK